MKRKITTLGMALSLFGFSLSSVSDGAERPTLNHTTCDPRPDILIHPIYDATTEYRRAYNRPRNVTGWMAYMVSRTSQEAMVWRENQLAGAYDERNCPPRYKRYFAPKPWEILQTGARPDFAEAPKSETSIEVVPWEDESMEDGLNAAGSSRVPPPLPQQTSPSDLRL